MSDLDEAYERLLDTGPERDGWLSNHAPMAVESLTMCGGGDLVHRWIDGYRDKLPERPRGITLPELPDRLWQPSLEAAWAACAAVTAAYSPAEARPAPSHTDLDIAEVMARAAKDGDPHAIKFVDTAIDVEHLDSQQAKAAATQAIELIAADT